MNGIRHATRQSDQCRPVGSGCVHDSDDVFGKLMVGVRRSARWSVGLSAAAAVARDDSKVAGQVGHLSLPKSRRNDGPRRKEHHCWRVLTAEHLVVKLHPVSFGEVRMIGLPCSHGAPSVWSGGSLGDLLASTALLQRLAKVALGSGLVDDVEGCLRYSAESVEPGTHHDVADACLAGLCTEGQADILRE